MPAPMDRVEKHGYHRKGKKHSMTLASGFLQEKVFDGLNAFKFLYCPTAPEKFARGRMHWNGILDEAENSFFPPG